MKLRSRLGLAAFLFLLLWIGTSWAYMHYIEPVISEALQKQKETTIRNVTDETINYTIKPADSATEPMNRALKSGEIDRFPGGLAMDIDFSRNGSMMMYRLEAGMSYSFRYDENDKLDLFEGSHGRVDAVDLAPYVTTPMLVVEKMLEMADLSEKDVLFDLGCGDGRIVILAAKKYNVRGVGIDIDPERIKEARANAWSAGVEKLVEFREQDATKADFSDATVVTLYLLPESNEILRPILEERLKPGSRVVSHNYHIPGWERREMNFLSFKTDDGEEHDIYVYKL